MGTKKQENVLETLRRRCNSKTLTHRGPLDDVFVIQNTTNNVTVEQEVHRFIVPLPDDKAAELAAKYGLDAQGLATLNGQLEQKLIKNISCNGYLSQENDKDVARYHRYIRLRPNKKDPNGHLEIYLIYDDPEEPLVGSEFISETGAKKSDILQLGLEMLEMVRTANDHGISLGTLDLNYMTKAQLEVKNLSFLCSYRSEVDQSYPIQSVVFTKHMHSQVAKGFKNPSPITDIYSVCSLLWGMLQGRNFNEAPDFNVLPTNISENLLTALQNGKAANRLIFNELRNALIEELESEDDPYITFRRPAYQDKLDAVRKETESQEKIKKQREEKEQKKKRKAEVSDLSKKLFRRILTACVLLSMVAIFLHLWRASNPAAKAETEETAAMEETEISTETGASEDTSISQEAAQTTSAEAGLYAYEGTVVNYYGIPSTRYYITGSGDIATNTSRYPQSMDELVYTDSVIDLSQVNIALSAETKVSPSFITENNISEGSVLSSGDTYKTVVSIKTSGDSTTMTLRDSYASEIYQNCDDDLLYMLTMLEKEPEANELYERVTEIDGKTTSLYYDADGLAHTEEEWTAQEELKEEIEEIKSTMNSYAMISGEQVLVPADGVEEYVYVECIEFNKETYTITLDTYTYGGEKETLFLINVDVLPSTATCQELIITLPAEGIAIPYMYNGPYILGEYSTYEYITSAVFDCKAGATPSILDIAVAGDEYGSYTISASTVAGYLSASSKIVLTNEEGYTEDIPDEITIPETKTETETQEESSTKTVEESSTSASSGTTGSTGSSSTGNNSSSSSTQAKTNEESSQSSASQQSSSSSSQQSSTESSSSESSAASSSGSSQLQSGIEMAQDAFQVYPSAVTLKVGESVDLCPNNSCRWASTNTGVAMMGGTAARTVYAVGAGSCTIIATASDGQVVYVSVTVTE